MSLSHGDSSWRLEMKQGTQRTEVSALLIRTAVTILPPLSPNEAQLRMKFCSMAKNMKDTMLLPKHDLRTVY